MGQMKDTMRPDFISIIIYIKPINNLIVQPINQLTVQPIECLTIIKQQCIYYIYNMHTSFIMVKEWL